MLVLGIGYWVLGMRVFRVLGIGDRELKTESWFFGVLGIVGRLLAYLHTNTPAHQPPDFWFGMLACYSRGVGLLLFA